MLYLTHHTIGKYSIAKLYSVQVNTNGERRCYQKKISQLSLRFAQLLINCTCFFRLKDVSAKGNVQNLLLTLETEEEKTTKLLYLAELAEPQYKHSPLQAKVLHLKSYIKQYKTSM